MLELRNTSRQSNKSPAELMLVRRARTLVPTIASNTCVMKEGDKQNKQQQSIENSYNKQAKDLPPLQVRQPVNYRNPGQTTGWNKGRIIKSKDCRYTVEGKNGGINQGNSAFLRPQLTHFEMDKDIKYVEEKSTNQDHTNSSNKPRPSDSYSHITPPNPHNNAPSNGERQSDHLSKAVSPTPTPCPGSKPKKITSQPAWMKDFVVFK